MSEQQANLSLPKLTYPTLSYIKNVVGNQEEQQNTQQNKENLYATQMVQEEEADQTEKTKRVIQEKTNNDQIVKKLLSDSEQEQEASDVIAYGLEHSFTSTKKYREDKIKEENSLKYQQNPSNRLNQNEFKLNMPILPQLNLESNPQQQSQNQNLGNDFQLNPIQQQPYQQNQFNLNSNNFGAGFTLPNPIQNASNSAQNSYGNNFQIQQETRNQNNSNSQKNSSSTTNQTKSYNNNIEPPKILDTEQYTQPNQTSRVNTKQDVINFSSSQTSNNMALGKTYTDNRDYYFEQNFKNVQENNYPSSNQIITNKTQSNQEIEILIQPHTQRMQNQNQNKQVSSNNNTQNFQNRVKGVLQNTKYMQRIAENNRKMQENGQNENGSDEWMDDTKPQKNTNISRLNLNQYLNRYVNRQVNFCMLVFIEKILEQTKKDDLLKKCEKITNDKTFYNQSESELQIAKQKATEYRQQHPIPILNPNHSIDNSQSQEQIEKKSREVLQKKIITKQVDRSITVLFFFDLISFIFGAYMIFMATTEIYFQDMGFGKEGIGSAVYAIYGIFCFLEIFMRVLLKEYIEKGTDDKYELHTRTDTMKQYIKMVRMNNFKDIGPVNIMVIAAICVRIFTVDSLSNVLIYVFNHVFLFKLYFLCFGDIQKEIRYMFISQGNQLWKVYFISCFLFLFYCILHLLTCLWSICQIAQENSTESVFYQIILENLNKQGTEFSDLGLSRQYTQTIYFVLTLFSGSNWDNEKVQFSNFDIAIILSMYFLFILFMVFLIKDLKDYAFNDNEYYKNLEYICRILKQENQSKKIVYQIIQKFQCQQENKQKLHKKQVYQKLMSYLPKDIKQEVNFNVMNKDNMETLFKTFSEQTRGEIYQNCEQIVFDENEIVFQEQKLDDFSLYYIVQGEVELYNQISKDSQPLRFGEKMKEQEFFGQYSFFTGLARECTVKTVKQCILHKISRENYLKILKKNINDFEKACQINYDLQFKITEQKVNDSLRGTIQQQKLNQEAQQREIVQCSFCKQCTHFVKECPYIYYKSDKKEETLKNHLNTLLQVQDNKFEYLTQKEEKETMKKHKDYSKQRKKVHFSDKYYTHLVYRDEEDKERIKLRKQRNVKDRWPKILDYYTQPQQEPVNSKVQFQLQEPISKGPSSPHKRRKKSKQFKLNTRNISDIKEDTREDQQSSESLDKQQQSQSQQQQIQQQQSLKPSRPEQKINGSGSYQEEEREEQTYGVKVSSNMQNYTVNNQDIIRSDSSSDDTEQEEEEEKQGLLNRGERQPQSAHHHQQSMSKSIIKHQSGLSNASILSNKNSGVNFAGYDKRFQSEPSQVLNRNSTWKDKSLGGRSVLSMQRSGFQRSKYDQYSYHQSLANSIQDNQPEDFRNSNPLKDLLYIRNSLVQDMNSIFESKLSRYSYLKNQIEYQNSDSDQDQDDRNISHSYYHEGSQVNSMYASEARDFPQFSNYKQSIFKQSCEDFSRKIEQKSINLNNQNPTISFDIDKVCEFKNFNTDNNMKHIQQTLRNKERITQLNETQESQIISDRQR